LRIELQLSEIAVSYQFLFKTVWIYKLALGWVFLEEIVVKLVTGNAPVNVVIAYILAGYVVA